MQSCTYLRLFGQLGSVLQEGKGFYPIKHLCVIIISGSKKMDFHSYCDLSSDDESDSRVSEGFCEDVSFGSDADEVLVHVDMSGVPAQGWLHEASRTG